MFIGFSIPSTTSILKLFDTSSQEFLHETIYVVFTVGETEIWAEVSPVDQRLLALQPELAKIIALPEQIVESENAVFIKKTLEGFYQHSDTPDNNKDA